MTRCVDKAGLALMIQDIVIAGGVFAAFTVALAIPPFILARLMKKVLGWPETIYVSLLMGLCCQAVGGLFWNNLFGTAPLLQICIFYTLWIVVGLSVFLSVRQHKSTPNLPEIHRSEGILLLFLLTLAVAVRLVHPLHHMALGQSDGYSHLQFLRFVVEQGSIGHAIYPPGYHWVLALPALTFGLDPYHLARYGGAFFGAGLVLGVYVLLRNTAGRSSALWGAFIAACFPGLMLLHKTGVGAFANQLGLLLIPAALYAYWRCLEHGLERYRDSVLFALVLLALAASVPMMLLHVLLIIGLERALTLGLRRENWLRQSLRTLMSTVPSLALLGWHVSRAGAGQREKTLQLMSAGGTVSVSPRVGPSACQAVVQETPVSGSWWNALTEFVLQHPLAHAVLDFLSIKRWGLGSGVMDAAGLLLLGAFSACVVLGFARRRQALLLLGAWGVLSAVQTMTGFLQFSAYQREGWSLLIAVAVLGGVVVGWIWDRWNDRVWLRLVAGTGVAGSIIWSLAFPPTHTVFISSAEDDIVRLARAVATSHGELIGLQGHRLLSREEQEFLAALDPRRPVTIVTRRLSGWKTGQGEIVPAVTGSSEHVRTVSVGMDTNMERVFRPGRQYLVLLDRHVSFTADQAGAFFHVNPEHAQSFARMHAGLYAPNERIRSKMKELARSNWRAQRFVVSDDLEMMVITQ